MNTVLTCLRGNGEHEHVDQGKNQHRQQHGQHQLGRMSPEGDLVVEKSCVVIRATRADRMPRTSCPQLLLSVGHIGVQISGRDLWLDVDRFVRINAPDKQLPLASLCGKSDWY